VTVTRPHEPSRELSAGRNDAAPPETARGKRKVPRASDRPKNPLAANELELDVADLAALDRVEQRDD